MKGSRVSGLAIVVEYALVILSFLAAVLLRVGWDGAETLWTFWGKGTVAALVIQFCFYSNDLYSTREVSTRWVLFRRFLAAFTVGAIILAVLYYLVPQLQIGRGVLLIMGGIFAPTFLTWRLALRRLLGTKLWNRRYLIMGTGEFAKEVGRILLDRKGLGYELVGFLDIDPERVGEPFLNPRVVGTYEEVSALVESLGIDEVIVALSNRRGTLPVRQLLELKFRGITITEGVTFYEREYNRIYVRQLNPSWIIFNEGFRVPALVQVGKRGLDLFGSSVGLLLGAPLMLATAFLIKVTSPGPIFYSQERAGQHGKPFKMWKFRSMRTDAEKGGTPRFAEENDPRITTIGRFIRKTRVDELPQILNILRGDMSLVGPRPERPYFIAQLKEKIPFYEQRLQVKPGLTGMAQVSHGYTSGEEDHLQKLQYDLCYIKNLSLGLDIAIIVKTVKVVILGTGAR